VLACEVMVPNALLVALLISDERIALQKAVIKALAKIKTR